MAFFSDALRKCSNLRQREKSVLVISHLLLTYIYHRLPLNYWRNYWPQSKRRAPTESPNLQQTHHDRWQEVGARMVCSKRWSRNYDSVQLSPIECAQRLMETSPATITFRCNLRYNKLHYVVDKLSCNLFNLRDDNEAEIKYIRFSELLSSFYVSLKCNDVKSLYRLMYTFW